MTTRHLARWLLATTTITVGLLVGQSVGAQSPARDIGPIPEVEDRALTADDLPDLIPVYGEGDEIIGYARAEEAFVELFDSSVDFVAFGIYEKDGETLIGHEIPGRGFVPGTEPIATSRAAVTPPPLDPSQKNPFGVSQQEQPG